VGGKDDEAAIGQVRGKIVIVRLIAFDHLFGDAPASMLADDDGPPFTGFEILGQQQDTPGKHVRPYVEHHLIANPFFGVVDLTRSRIEGRQRFIESAQDFFRKVLAVLFGAFNELVGRNRLVTKFPGPGFGCQFGRCLVQKETVADML
jgi:hypothetical protein